MAKEMTCNECGYEFRGPNLIDDTPTKCPECGTDNTEEISMEETESSVARLVAAGIQVKNGKIQRKNIAKAKTVLATMDVREAATKMQFIEKTFLKSLQVAWEVVSSQIRDDLESVNKEHTLPTLEFDTNKMIFITRVGQFPPEVQTKMETLTADFFPVLEPWLKKLGGVVVI